jgi:hypothetical protein
MKLIRCTTIEKFNRYINERSSYDSEQDLIKSITGEFQGNSYTYIGTAFHRIVEGNYEGITKVGKTTVQRKFNRKMIDVELPEGRKFDIDGHDVFLDVHQCKIALDYKEEMPLAAHEIREFIEMEDVMITGAADIVDGLEIHDIKTKFSPVEDNDYIESFQWKLYCEMFGCERFIFDLFVFEGYDKDKHGTDVRGLPLTRYSPPINCYAYSGMYEDNRYMVREFIKWAKFRGLYDGLPEYNEENIKNLH